MPRNRVIEPAFWSDKKLSKLSYFDRLFFIALWNFADDYGRGKAIPKELAGFAFPHDEEIGAVEIREALARLAGNGRIRLYSIDGEDYYCIPSWGRHQRVDHPSKSSIPPQPDDLATDSRESRESLSPKEKGIEEKGREGEAPPAPPIPDASSCWEDDFHCEAVGAGLSDSEQRWVLTERKKRPGGLLKDVGYWIRAAIRHRTDYHSDVPAKNGTVPKRPPSPTDGLRTNAVLAARVAANPTGT